MPIIVMLEVRKIPDLLVGKFKHIPLDTIRSNFRKIMDEEVKAGNIRALD